MRRWPDTLRVSTQGDKCIDDEVYAVVNASYETLQNEKRMDAEIQANNDGQIGDSRKVKRGRIFRDLWSAVQNVDDMVQNQMTKGVQPVMEKAPASDVDMAWKILEDAYRRAGDRVDESHLNTRVVRDAAGRLKAARVSCADIAAMSAAIYLVNSVTSAASRKQDGRGTLAKDTYVDAVTKRLVTIVPSECKDDRALMNSDRGMVVLHKKHGDLEKPYAVLVVLGRALMRLEGKRPDPESGPLDANGEQVRGSRQSGLFVSCGKRYLGIRRFGEHAVRTIHVSMLATSMVEVNIADPKYSDSVNQAVKEVRTSMNVALKQYNTAKSTCDTGWNILDMGHKGRVSERNRKKTRTEESESDLVQEIMATVIS